MASAPLAEDLASAAYPRVADAARVLGMGPADRVRLEAVALRLRAEGIAGDDPRVPLWFAAALCRSAEQRRAFLLECGARLASAPESEPDPADRDIADDSAATADFLKKHWRRLALVGGVLLLALAAIVAAALLLPQPPDDTTGVPPPPPIGSAMVEKTMSAPRQASVAVVDWVTLAMLAAIVAAVIFYLIWRRHWLSELKRSFAPDPDRAVPLVLRQEEMRLFASGAIRSGLRRLRRHRSQPGGRLDVRASIAATIRAGGQPQARFRGRWLMPEYLLLSEREGPRDHLAMAADALAERIAQENVAIGHYEFLGRPDRLRAAAGERSIVLLASVLARHADARSMLLAESFDLRHGALTPAWIERLTDAGPAVHLNPRLDGGRSESEALLAEDGVDSFPLSARGIAAMAQRLADPRGGKGPLGGGPARFDLARGLDGERKLLLAEEAPRPMIVAGVLEDLAAGFDPDTYRWLAALSLFPYLEPALTLYLGSHLKDANGAPVLTDERYLALSRLPWMRSGSMPRWLRLALAHTLDPATLASATAAIQAFLLPVLEGEASDVTIEDGRDPAKRRLLLAWLASSPDSEFHDPILIDTVKGRRPEQLGVRPAEGFARRLKVMRDNPRLRAIAVMAAAGAVVLLARPPVDDAIRNTGEEETITYKTTEPQPIEDTTNPPGDVLTNETVVANASTGDPLTNITGVNGGEIGVAGENGGKSGKGPPRGSPTFDVQGRPIVFTYDQSEPADLPAAVIRSMHNARRSAINSSVDPKTINVVVSFDIWVDRSVIKEYDDATYRPGIADLLRKAIAEDRPKYRPSIFALSGAGPVIPAEERDVTGENCGTMCVVFTIRTTGYYKPVPSSRSDRDLTQQMAR